MSSVKDIKIITINACSIVSQQKRIHLYNLLNLHNPDFALIQETRLKIKHKVNFKNYTFYRTDSNDFPGTAVAVKSTYKLMRIPSPNFVCFDSSMVNISLAKNENMLVASLYIKCNSSRHDIHNDLNLLNSMCEKFTYCVIGGDFNGRNFLWNDSTCNYQGNVIENWLTDPSKHHNLIVISQNESTRPVSNSLLDFFLISNNLVNILPSQVNFQVSTDIFESDHLCVIVSIDTNRRLEFTFRRDKPKLRTDWKEFSQTLDNAVNVINIRKDTNLTNSEIENFLDILQSNILSSIDQNSTILQNKYKYDNLPSSIQNLYKLHRKMRKRLQTIYHNTLNTQNPEYITLKSLLNQ